LMSSPAIFTRHVVFHARAGGNQAAHDNVFLESAQVVHLSVGRGFDQHPAAGWTVLAIEA
jgi:hypothetical protein